MSKVPYQPPLSEPTVPIPPFTIATVPIPPFTKGEVLGTAIPLGNGAPFSFHEKVGRVEVSKCSGIAGFDSIFAKRFAVPLLHPVTPKHERTYLGLLLSA